MSKELTQPYESLIEECKDLLSARTFSFQTQDLEWRLNLGQIVATSAFYKKSAKGNGEAVAKIAEDIGISQSSLYECILFYSKFKTIEEVMNLETGHKGVKWSRDIRPKLIESPKECKHENQENQDILIHRVKCVDCGRTLVEEKTIK